MVSALFLTLFEMTLLSGAVTASAVPPASTRKTPRVDITLA